MLLKSPVEKRIAAKFRLFKGERSEEEDAKIYYKILDNCLFESIKFIEDNVNDQSKDQITFRLKEISQQATTEEEKTQQTSRLLDEFLETVPDGKYRLQERLFALIDNLFYSSLKNSLTK